MKMSDISAVLNNSFCQRQVSVMYGPLNQYHVVMGVSPQSSRSDARVAAQQVNVIAADGQRVPLSAFASLPGRQRAADRCSTRACSWPTRISFSLAPGVSLGQATAAIDAAVARIGLPSDQIQAGFQGTAAAELQQDAGAAAVADPGGAGHHVHRAGHPVRKPAAPAHHPVHAAVGGHRRAAGADAGGRGVHPASR